MGDMDDVIKEFLVESYENLDRLDQDLLVLEKSGPTREMLSSIFRTLHTIKGTCGFLGFKRLESVTHCGETLLSRLRDGKIEPSSDLAAALLDLVVAIREMLTSIETSESEGDGEYPTLLATLKRIAAEPGASIAPAPAAAPAPVAPPVAAPPPVAKTVAVVTPPEDLFPASPEPLPDPPPRRPSQVIEEGLQDIIFAAPPEARTSVADSFVRVNTGVLDRLMDLVGELVLARNQILQFTGVYEDQTFLTTSQRLNLITSELQEGIMKTRMQPISGIWNKLPRVARDVATTCGKQVRVDMEGSSTELDRTIIEAIKDPLTHVIRNSVDHGIERAADRVDLGKPPEGVIKLRAFHEGGQVNIEISDDGAGISPQRVKDRAIQRGLITRDQGSRMLERELINLIFLPGFSTAEQVTNVSGRGVGMDVVRTNVERIGGTIDLQSRFGEGTRLRIKIPLTLAIIPALIITTGGERFAIPQVSLLELVRFDGDQAKGALESVFGSPVYRLRGSLLPIIYLNRELELDRGLDGEGAVERDSNVNVVVVQADDRQFGIVVDDISDTQEIVVKPLGKQLSGTKVFAGATILGDGKVALILDVLGLAQRANIVSEVRERTMLDSTSAAQEATDTKQALLLLGVHDGGRMAMPLSMVARLEEFPRASIERIGGRDVVQYRGEIMPLVRVSAALPERRRESRGGDPGEPVNEDSVQVVVHCDGGRSVGLIVDRILDIVEENLTMQGLASRPGVLGSAVIQSRVTEILDVHGMICAAHPSFALAAE
jgi:two-component system chemotaxis sensor kinase CheA